MKLSHLSFLLLFVLGCASKTKILESNFQRVKQANTGVLLTVNLDTNGKVRSDKSCYLNIQDGQSRYELTLDRGSNNYALPLVSARAEIVKISCGPFYYFDLQNQGADFKVSENRVKYIGAVDFKFKKDGTLEWGHATKNTANLEERVRSMGFEGERVEVELLKL